MRIRLSNQAIKTLLKHAKEGNDDADCKREVGGHLLGFKDGCDFYLSRVEPYKKRFVSRTRWEPDWDSFEKKGRQLETARLSWIGVYHSHVEIRRTSSVLQSGRNELTHKFSTRPLEVIVRVTNYGMKWPRGCLSYKKNDYWFDICGYIKDSRGKIKRIKVVETQ